MKTTIEELHRLTLRQTGSETELTRAMGELQVELDAVQRKHLGKIKRLAAAFAESDAELRHAVHQGRELFKDRKTMLLNGQKIGVRTVTGKLVFDDVEAVIELIREHFPNKAKALIETLENPRVAVIKATLTEDQWKQIGCRIEGAGEAVVVSSTDSEVEKTIANMVKKLVASMVDTDKLKEAA